MNEIKETIRYFKRTIRQLFAENGQVTNTHCPHGEHRIQKIPCNISAARDSPFFYLKWLYTT